MADLEHDHLLHVLREIISDVAFPVAASHSFLHRTHAALRDKGPKLKEALRRSCSDILHWTHCGGPWRAFLVISVGIILLLALAGLGAFIIFFITATLNAVAIGFLASLASVGAFAALFFTSLIAIYVGALVIAVITISTITFCSICAVLTAAGWIAFIWVLWKGTIKGANMLQDSVLMTCCAFTAVTSSASKYSQEMKY